MNFKLDKNHIIFRHKHILLADDHYNPLGIARSLGEVGIRMIAVIRSKTPRMIGHCRYVDEIYSVDSFEEGLKLIVEKFGKEQYKPFIYNASDESALVLDNHYEELKEKFFFNNGQGNLSKWLRKYELTMLADKCGLRIPREELLKVGDLPTTLNYPVFTKAATSACKGNWKEQAFICKNEKELLEAYSSINEEEILVQEYIEKENELCIDGFSYNDGKDVVMPYGCHYFRFPPDGYGNYMYFFPLKEKELCDKLKKMFQQTKFTGIFSVEFMKDSKGDYYFLEINFRNSTWSYANTWAGINLPLCWALSCIEIPSEGFDITPKEHFTAIAEIDDLLSMVFLHKKVSIFKWLKDFISADVRFIFNKKDILPFFYALYNNIAWQIHKRIPIFRGK